MVIFELKEEMARQIKLYSLLFLFGFILGCTPIISEELRAGVDTSLTFKEVVQNPNTYEGKIVLWGGRIIQTLPQEDGTNLIEVLEWPLSWREKPRRTVSFQGKFLVLSKVPFDLSLYRRGG
jgi:outer membrane lipoprotein